MLPEIPVMAKQLLESINDGGHLADLITANIDATINEKQEILEAVHLKRRLKKVLELLSRQYEVLKLSNKINSQVKGEMSRTQREYYLRQQLKAIKDELGDKDDDENGIDELERRLNDADLTEEAVAAQRELRRMRNMQPSQAEYTVFAPIWSGSPIFHGINIRKIISILTMPSNSWTVITTALKRLKSVSLNISL